MFEVTPDDDQAAVCDRAREVAGVVLYPPLGRT